MVYQFGLIHLYLKPTCYHKEGLSHNATQLKLVLRDIITTESMHIYNLLYLSCTNSSSLVFKFPFFLELV